MNRREFNTLMATTLASVLVAGQAAFAGSKDDKDACKGKNGCGTKPKTTAKDQCKSATKGKPHTTTKPGAKKPAKPPATN